MAFTYIKASAVRKKLKSIPMDDLIHRRGDYQDLMANIEGEVVTILCEITGEE